MAALCESFRKEAGRVWNQMAAARRMGLFLGEETITETCLYNICKSHWKSSIAVIPATKPQETVHGADWEWWFTRNGRGVGFRIQAKRLFPSGRYESLFKPGDKYGQLKKLVARSKADGLDPLFCFYNFDHSNGLAGYPNTCSHAYRGPTFWGCALALPEDVELTASDAIEDLRFIMKPWHSLVCQSSPYDDLPASVLANVNRMAAPRPIIRAERAFHREAVGVASEPRALPSYVSRLIGLGRTIREMPPRERTYLDFAYWSSGDTPSQDIAGITVIDDARET